MGAVPGVSRVRGVRLFLHRFEENDRYAVIDVSHNGYVFTDDPIFHRRRAVRLEKDVYILDDEVTGLGLAAHDLRLYFNFAPGQLTGAGDAFAYETARGRRYRFVTACDQPVESVLMEGSEEPIGGWVSYGYSLRVPAPQLIRKARGPVPLRHVTVIVPEDCAVACEVSGKRVMVKVTGTRPISLTIEGDQIIRA